MKLVRMMKYLQQTQNYRLTLRMDDSEHIHWFVDSSFAVHPDCRSHTGAAATLGKGAVINISRKQSINTRSSTEAELVGVDDIATPMLWTARFMEAQGYPLTTVLHQDNKSTILLAENGRKSAGKRTRHMNIRYFFITDLVKQGLIKVNYCPTDKMFGDYHTKPLHGAKFREFREWILNMQPSLAAQLMMIACIVRAEK
jgi:hypothetical protein